MDRLRKAAAIFAVAMGVGLAGQVNTATAEPSTDIGIQETRQFTGEAHAIEWEVAERAATGRAYSNAEDAGFPRAGCVLLRVHSIPINGFWYATATVECTR